MELLQDTPNRNSISASGWMCWRIAGLACVALLLSPMIAEAQLFPILRPSVPEGLNKPGVVVGKDRLVKSEYFSDKSLGAVTDFTFKPAAGAELGVAGNLAAVYLDKDAKPVARVKYGPARRSGLLGVFGPPLTPTIVEFIDLDGNGVSGFLNRGGVGWEAGSYYDKEGRTLWTYGGSEGLDNLAAGDFDGDNIVDFVAGMNGDGGVRRLDVAGKVKWKQKDGNVWHVEIVDTDDDGEPEIVHTGAGGGFTIRDKDGSTIRELSVENYCSTFSLCPWPTAAHPARILAAMEETIWLFDLEGKALATLPAPHCESLRGEARGTPVRLADGEPWLAVVVDYNLYSVSVLHLFNRENELVYEEILPHSCSAITALPVGETDRDELLVGGIGKVWKYTAVTKKP